MAWVKPLVKVVKAVARPRPAWWDRDKQREDKVVYDVTLACGHVVKRTAYNSRPLPARCQCSQCRYSVPDFPPEPEKKKAKVRGG